MNNAFHGKVALISGGTSGIGRASALAFARAGARVVVSGRRAKEGDEVVSAIKAAGGEALFVQGDVSKEADVQALVANTVTAFGRLDVAFNNAGIEGDSGIPIAEQTTESFDRVFGINVRGVFFCMKAEILQMLKNGGGAIVNNSSVGGLIGFPGTSIYVASKHAVLGLTKSAGLEYARAGIRVNAVCPGPVQTELLDRFIGTAEQDTEFRKHVVAANPIGRLGTAEEIAAAVLFLCSDGASFITGQSLTADGGWTAQ